MTPVILNFPDGRMVNVDKGVTAAFAALAQGRATEGQQKLCLQWIMDISQPMAFASATAGERAAGMCDGARFVGLSIARLVGGDSPWTLKHLGDLTHDD